MSAMLMYTLFQEVSKGRCKDTYLTVFYEEAQDH